MFWKKSGGRKKKKDVEKKNKQKKKLKGFDEVFGGVLQIGFYYNKYPSMNSKFYKYIPSNKQQS